MHETTKPGDAVCTTLRLMGTENIYRALPDLHPLSSRARRLTLPSPVTHRDEVDAADAGPCGGGCKGEWNRSTRLRSLQGATVATKLSHLDPMYPVLPIDRATDCWDNQGV